MEKTTVEQPVHPTELWDKLAFNQLKKVLAPQGYKKIMNGKHEVSNIDFLTRERVETVSVMAANMIRLYRENLKDHLTDMLVKAKENLAAGEKALAECAFHEIGAKSSLKTLVSKKEIEVEVLTEMVNSIQLIKPAAPKNAVKPRNITPEQKIEVVGEGSKLVIEK